MDKIFLRAPAKLNLSLDITGRREDGYHLLEMIFQAIDLFDFISIERTANPGLTLSCNLPGIPDDSRNIAWKAAEHFLSSPALPPYTGGFQITLQKQIPHQAGMGGGSADGAAVLMGLNELYEKPFTIRELCAMGVQIGADIPFCMVGGTCLAKGSGEALTPLRPFSAPAILVAKPKAGVSTVEAYALFDRLPAVSHPDTPRLLSLLEQGDWRTFAAHMQNVLEQAVPLTEIAELRRELGLWGSLGSQMTGSGSAVFGIYESILTAERARQHLQERFGSELQTFICRPFPHGVETVPCSVAC